MTAHFELFDHTADLGIRVSAPTAKETVQFAAAALYAAIGELRAEGEARPELLSFSGPDRAMLLRDCLAELLMLFETEHRMITRLEVTMFDTDRLEATGESRIVSRSASLFDREVKAITYHGLKFEQRDDGYTAECIVDI